MTADKKPLTLEESLAALEEEHQDFEDVKAVLAMSSTELDKKLEEQGFDLATVDARARAREAEIRREQDKPAPKPWSKTLIALVAAASTAVGIGVTHAIDVVVLAAPLTADALRAPPQLRQDAFEACGKMRWQTCIDKLDEAARTDPDGDKTPDVQRARAFAKKQLASQVP